MAEGVRRLSAAPQELDAAKAFVRARWRERAAERGMPDPGDDLAGACKFASLFAQAVFGGDLRGNYDHQFVVIDGIVIDLCEEASDVRDLVRRGSDPHRHDPEFWGNPDHQESLASCQPRVARWVEQYLDLRGGLLPPQP